MTVGVGDDVAEYAATPEQPRVTTDGRARLLAAFGGAVVVVCVMLLGTAWSEGLRSSTVVELRADIASGWVQEWYVADDLSQGDFDLMEARQAPLEGPAGTGGSTGPTTDGTAEPTGGILVWRTWGSPGWKVAASDTGLGAFSQMGTGANEQSRALVQDLRDAGVSLRPFDFGDQGGLDQVAGLGVLLVLAGLAFGSAPRVGTRWFWLWMFLNAPLALDFIGYAVLELVGIRRRPDPPLDKRLSGLVGFVGALLMGLAFRLGADFLRSRGVPLPM